jgi:hypothetical protein
MIRRWIITLLLLSSPTCQDRPQYPEDSEMPTAEDEPFEVWTSVVDFDLRLEAAGDDRTGRFESWQDLWLARIRAHRDSKNFRKYVGYLIRKRHEMGLSELPGYAYDDWDEDG